jgi:beta-glucosidase
MAVSAPGFRGGDRDDIELPAIQRETMAALKKAGKQVVLVNFSGSAMALVPETENCDAILQAWYPGQEGGSALADVLYGNASPSGKLPLTFYRSVDQLPDFQDYNMKGKTYRYFEGDPLFCFGHGLTYTEFFYGKPKSDKRTLKEGQTLYVTVPVGNIGTREGTEIVQLYIDRPSDVEGPIQALRDYRRVTLAPGASEMVVFELTEEGKPWIVPEGIRAGLAFRTEHGAMGEYDTMPDGTAAGSVAGNVVTLSLAPQLLTAASSFITGGVRQSSVPTLWHCTIPKRASWATIPTAIPPARIFTETVWTDF